MKVTAAPKRASNWNIKVFEHVNGNRYLLHEENIRRSFIHNAKDHRRIGRGQCQKGGWKTFTIPRKFKNRGHCVSFVNTRKIRRDLAAGLIWRPATIHLVGPPPFSAAQLLTDDVVQVGSSTSATQIPAPESFWLSDRWRSR